MKNSREKIRPTIVYTCSRAVSPSPGCGGGGNSKSGSGSAIGNFSGAAPSKGDALTNRADGARAPVRRHY